VTTDKRVFLAGATGAIGRVLCRLLVSDGWSVVGTTRKAEAANDLKVLGVEPSVVDVFDAVALRTAVLGARPTAVIHQLTDLPKQWTPEDMKKALARNARLREVGTKNLVDACVAAGVSHVIAQSIAFAYAPGPQPFSEEAGGCAANGNIANLTYRSMNWAVGWAGTFTWRGSLSYVTAWKTKTAKSASNAAIDVGCRST
jgi:nucleoside-diphosphate-sugar epimerase